MGTKLSSSGIINDKPTKPRRGPLLAIERGIVNEEGFQGVCERIAWLAITVQ